MSEISHLATDKDIVTMVTALIGSACLLIGGIIGFFTKYFYENKKINESKKALRQQMITNNIAPMRQAWINEVRQKSAELLADFHLILYGKISKNNKTQLSIIKDSDILDLMTTIQYKSSYLSLLLPLSTEKKPEEKSKQIAKHLNILMKMSALPNDKVVKEQVNKELRECIQTIKELIKDEWEVTKSLKEIE